MAKIRKVRKVAAVAKIGEIGTGKIREAVEFDIPWRKRITGRVEDPLEKAAMPIPIGTLPERIVWKWLEDHGYQYRFQQAEMGGRDVIGGAVIDFLVWGFVARPMVIRVQGTYWHGPSFPERQRRDDEQRARLHQMAYIVCDLWEHDIYAAVLDDRLTAYMEDELTAAI